MIIDGKRVVNATKQVLIKITPADVKNGKSKKPDACAAALACQRDIGCSRARVHISTTYLEMGNKWVRYRTPGALRDEIISFDRGTDFHPGEFVLRPLQPSHRATGRRIGSVKAKKTKHSGTQPGTQRAQYHITSGVRPSPRSSV